MNSKFYGRNVKTINIKKYLENISEKNIKTTINKKYIRKCMRTIRNIKI